MSTCLVTIRTTMWGVERKTEMKLLTPILAAILWISAGGGRVAGG